MSRLGGWFRSGAKQEAPSATASANGSAQASDTESARPSTSTAPTLTKKNVASSQADDIKDAMQKTSLIMNDDVDGAWEALQLGDSVFHELGAAVTFFIRSVIGFEKGVMAQASAKLMQCETRAGDDLKKAQKRKNKTGGSEAEVYPQGTEYELVRAQSQLMGAVVGVLHESILEAMKGFYKLRKAYITLDAIVAIDPTGSGKRENGVAAAMGEIKSAETSEALGATEDDAAAVKESDKDEFVDAPEEPESQTETAPTSADTSAGPSTGITTPEKDTSESATKLQTAINDTKMEQAMAGLNISSSNPVDIFIFSGASMCFGLLLMLLTLIPPAFSRILSAVGFRGDRAKGVKMLWQSATFPNVYGAVAGMALLSYYHALLGAVDIVPSDADYDEAAETVGPPKEKRDRLLAEMRRRYPDSQLWRVEEARKLGSEHQLDKAIELLQNGGEESKMKQIRALNNFELSISAMYAQRWELSRDTFLECVRVNDWSPAIYYYNAGCASIELYRNALQRAKTGGNDADATAAATEEASKHKQQAEELLRKAPTAAGKKKFMAKPLPFESFLQRKVARWEERAKELGVDLADAVGSSPAMEMCYMWNGANRMGRAQLESGLEALAWERCTANPEAVAKIKEDKGEMAVWAVCMAAMVRRMGRFEEARGLLKDHVLQHDRSIFKGPGKDDYVMPVATYEMAVLAWDECCKPPAELSADPASEAVASDGDEKANADDGEKNADNKVLAYRKEKLEECQEYLEKAKAWETFVMDARLGIRMQSGMETLKWFRAKMGWEQQ